MKENGIKWKIQKEIFFKIGGHGKLPWDDVNKCTDEVINLFMGEIDLKIQEIREKGLYYDDMKTRGLEELKKELKE